MATHAARWGRKAKRGWTVLRVIVLSALLGALGLLVAGCPPVVLYGPQPLYGPEPVYGVPAAYSIDQ